MAKINKVGKLSTPKRFVSLESKSIAKKLGGTAGMIAGGTIGAGTGTVI